LIGQSFRDRRDEHLGLSASFQNAEVRLLRGNFTRERPSTRSRRLRRPRIKTDRVSFESPGLLAHQFDVLA
jgi:hypothetical protein